MANEKDFKANVAFDEIRKVLKQEGASVVKKIKGTYLFKVKNKNGQQGFWFVNVKDGDGSVEFCEKKADCTITMGDDDLLGLMTGTLNAQKAFMQGKLKITGNMGLAMKLKDLQPANPPKARL
ncbi:sterol carrier protein 2-like [Watersipora subatra]|uniref:sterol carrier protein 2-like n=1 Tax=Watersipora subatra TaxID=2589382 RepID=UPI00355B2FD1